MPNTHIILDIQTLSTNSDAKIIEIGACELLAPGSKRDPQTRATFRRIVPAKGQEGGRVDPSTLTWWCSQGGEMSAALSLHETNPLDRHARDVLEEFSLFCKELAPDGDLAIWASNPALDIATLKNLYTKLEMPIPWLFYKQYCISTVNLLIGYRETLKGPSLDQVIKQATFLESLVEHKAFIPPGVELSAVNAPSVGVSR